MASQGKARKPAPLQAVAGPVDTPVKPPAPSPPRERVRGMNAAIAAGASPPPTSGGTRHHMRPWQIVVATLLVAAALLAAVFTVRAVTQETAFPAVLRASYQADLNFGSVGRLAEVDVRPGDRVSSGQVLAREDQTVARANLDAAKAVLAADQAALQQLQSPQLSSAAQAQVDLQVNQAQVQLTNAESALQAAQAVAQAQIAQQQTTVTSAQAVVTGDQTRFNQACPNGAVPPSPNPAQPTTSPTPTPTPLVPGPSPTPSPSPTPNNGVSLNAYINCLTLQSTLDKDTAAMNAAKGALGVVQAMAAQTATSSAAGVALNEALLRLASNQGAVQTAPGTPAQIAIATGQIAKDQAAVALSEDALAQTTIVAPTNGVVANVNGGAGELVSDTGVHNYPGPAALGSTSSSFSLFPPAPAAPGTTSQDAFVPLVTVYSTGDMPVVAQVPESQISNVHLGQSASVSITALSKTIAATVDRVISDPAQVPGSVTYDVILRAKSWPAAALPGMSATVQFG